MKQCSVCEREFADDNLKFCTACGGALKVGVGGDEPAYDPLKTMVATPRPSREELRAIRNPVEPVRSPLESSTDQAIVNPTWSQIESQVDDVAPGEKPSQGLALGAMILGLSTMLCGVTSLLGPLAAILGFVALSKHKSAPQRYGGKNFAIVGIVSGILGTVIFLALCIILLVTATTSWR